MGKDAFDMDIIEASAPYLVHLQLSGCDLSSEWDALQAIKFSQLRIFKGPWENIILLIARFAPPVADSDRLG